MIPIPFGNLVDSEVASIRWPRRVDTGMVFLGPAGRGGVSIRGRFHRALREAGIEGPVWHDLRHTFASYPVMAEGNLTSIKELMGHETIAMILRYAPHLAPDFQRDAINRLATNMEHRACKTHGKWLKCGMRRGSDIAFNAQVWYREPLSSRYIDVR